MFWLSTSTIVRLRDQLRAAGQRSMVEVGPNSGDRTAEETELLKTEYGPLCEAMYLVMTSDGEITSEETEVLRGALKNLSGDTLDGDLIESMLETATESEKSHGRDSRLREVVEILASDHARAEVAFILAAAIAFADNTIADEENSLLDTIAEGLGIDESRMDVLLDSVEKDLGN